MRRGLAVLLLLLLLLVLPRLGEAAVAFEAVGTAQTAASGTTLPGIPITLGGSGLNRAVVVHVALGSDTTNVTATMGGETFSIVSGTNGSSSTGTVILCKSTTLTGSQTVTVTWTGGTSQSAAGNAISFTGANQNADAQQVCNNGTFGSGASPFTMNVTSNAGDRTTSVDAETSGTGQSTNQTSRWSATSTEHVAGDTGPGTAGPIAHTWTEGSNTQFGSACNVVQAAGGAVVVPRRTLLGVGQ